MADDTITLAFHTTLWKRPRLTELVLEHLVRVREQAKPNILTPIVAVVSPDEDPDSLVLARRYADHVVEWPNRPVGAKNNAGGRACYELGCDGLMTIGSDDFIGVGWVRRAAMALQRGAVAATLPGCAYLVSGRPPFYIRGSTHAGSDQWAMDQRALPMVGAGRVYGREMLEATKGELWPGSNNTGLDTGAYCNTVDHWRRGLVYVWDGSLPPVLDVKTRGGITPASRLAMSAAEELPDWWACAVFGQEVQDAIEELSCD